MEPYFLDKLGFSKGRFMKLHLIVLLFEDINRSLVDVFEKQDLDILGDERLELLPGRRGEIATRIGSGI